ncbi:MAG: hypothetical protein AAGF74_06560 [Pseudomonadota bacterium]
MTLLRGGMIGENIGNSRFARAFEIMCTDHGLRLEFSPIDTKGLEAFDFVETVDQLRQDGWTAVTVTHPWKPDAASYAGDTMGAGVAALGAANILSFKGGLAGHNTDYHGFLGAWRAGMGDAAPGRVAMAGAGGVARALGPALARLGAEEIAIWDPSPGLAETLAGIIGPSARVIALEEAPEVIAQADGLVNATPLGMAGYGGTAFAPEYVGGQSWAFDAVYTPTDTEFLRTAGAKDLEVLTGFDLFRHMALASFEAYSGIAPDAGTTLPKLGALRPREESA